MPKATIRRVVEVSANYEHPCSACGKMVLRGQTVVPGGGGWIHGYHADAAREAENAKWAANVVCQKCFQHVADNGSCACTDD